MIFFRRALLFLSTCLAPAALAARITFGAPVHLGTSDYYTTGFQALDDLHSLGRTTGGWVASSDGGKSFVKLPAAFAPPGDVSAAVRGPGPTLHNLGTITSTSKDKSTVYNNLTSPTSVTFSATTSSSLADNNCLPIGAGPCGLIKNRCCKGSRCNLLVKECLATEGPEGSTSSSSPAPTPPTNELASTWHYKVENRSITFESIPAPGITCGTGRAAFGCPFRTGGRGYVRLPDTGELVMSIIVFWGGSEHSSPNAKVAKVATSVVAFRSKDEGYTWQYSGSILDAKHAPASQEGPNENDLVLLADGKTIMCVVRLDAGDGGVTHPYVPYSVVLSKDGGRTWGTAAPLPPHVGCARPRLLRTDGGQVLLAGGRLNSTNRDVLMWLHAAGDGSTSSAAWEPHSITYWHNRLEPNASLHFDGGVNNSHLAPHGRETTSYTSLVRTGAQTGFITYARHLPPSPDIAFAMPFAVVE